jgi:hypothetical protein
MALVFQYRLVSHVPGSTTTAGNASSGGGGFSPDGRYVLFDSLASNLAGSDSNAGSDLFFYDTQDFSVDLVSHIPGSTTTAANLPTDAGGAFFSPDSRYVLFDSTASNLTGSDNNAASDLFLYDTQDGSVDLVSHVLASTTTTGNGSTDATRAFFSPDGHWGAVRQQCLEPCLGRCQRRLGCVPLRHAEHQRHPGESRFRLAIYHGERPEHQLGLLTGQP